MPFTRLYFRVYTDDVFFRRYYIYRTMEDKTIKAILFDLDNTLIQTSVAGGVAIQKTSELLQSTLHLDDDTIHHICNKFKQKLREETFDPSGGRSIDQVRVGHWEESLVETLSDGSAAESVAARCYDLWKSSRLQMLTMSPEVCQLLRQLRGRYKLLLLTNGEAQTQREKVQVSGCEEFFDAIVVGGDHTEQKPFVSIFRLCFDMLGVDAQDCVMVGDSLDTDIQGGFNARVRATVWINTGGGGAEDVVKPDYTIATVLDLPAVLEELN